MKRHVILRTISKTEGSSLIETAILMPMLLVLLVGTVDLGRGFYALHEVSSAAEAGALYGASQVWDITGIVMASQTEAVDLPAMVTTASFGCECSDGSSASTSCTSLPSCVYNAVDFVEVDTSYPFKPLFAYPGMPSLLNMTGKARMRTAH